MLKAESQLLLMYPNMSNNYFYYYSMHYKNYFKIYSSNLQSKNMMANE